MLRQIRRFKKIISTAFIIGVLCLAPAALAGAEDVSIGEGRFSGTITHDGTGNIILDFVDVQVTLPPDWSGKCAVKANDEYSVSFYHKASRDLWSEQLGYANGGHLFTLCFSQYIDYEDLPAYKSLGTTAEGYYYAQLPTDMQGYADDEAALQEYYVMSAEVESILDGVNIKNSAVPQNSSYILPLSSTTYLVKTDLEGMDQSRIQMAINEIYARRHRMFTIAEVREYFEAQPWYDGYIAPEDFDTETLNSCERANIDLMASYLKELS